MLSRIVLRLGAVLLLFGAPFLLTGCLVPFPMIETVPLPTFYGSVVSAGTQKPIPRANVVVVGHPSTAAWTDPEGRFRTQSGKTCQFTLLSAGYTPQSFRLRVAVNGYKESEKKVVRPIMIGNWHLIEIGIPVGTIPLEKNPTTASALR